MSTARAELARFRRPSIPAVIPVSRDGWEAVLEDAGVIAGSPPLAAELLDLVDPSLPSSPTGLRSAADRLLDAMRSVEEGLWCVDAFLPAGGHGLGLREAMTAAIETALDCAVGTATVDDVMSRRAAVESEHANLLAIASFYPFPADACQAAFGVAYDSLVDSTGVFSAARLLASYYGRYPELVRRVNSVLSVVTASPPDLVNALHPAEGLVIVDRPLIALPTAIRTRDLLASKLGVDLEAVAGPLRELKLGVDRRAASHAGMIRTLAQLEAARTEADRASLSLDLYRRMAEGQLRPWACTLLRLCGRSSAKAPELSSLRDQLLAEGRPLLADAAQVILPARCGRLTRGCRPPGSPQARSSSPSTGMAGSTLPAGATSPPLR